MSIAKPFTFVANTHAKSSEVNANFDTVYSQVNTNISQIAQNATDIDNLENNKADINGSSAQRFAVADAITNSDAINKQSLMKSIGNSLDYISGFTITKDSGSPNDTIIVSEGSCYNTTHTAVLSLANSLSKQNTNQAASATYYIYVIGNATGSSVDILISSSSTTPALPSGYTLYRQIGYYTTDSSNDIENIIFYGDDNSSGKSPISTLLRIMPDYSKAVTVLSSSGGGSLTVDWDGWLEFDLYCRQNSAAFQFYIDDVMVGATASDEMDRASNIVMVKKGNVASWNGSQSIVIKKVPVVGV